MEKRQQKKEEPPQKCNLFQNEDSEEEETLVEQVEEYGGPTSYSNVEQGAVSGWEHAHENDTAMACGLSQVLRRRKRSAMETGDEQFRRELESAAPEVSKEAYERVPVESFGKYMLSKMGWKGEEYRQVEQWQTKARPPRLGLGAQVPHNSSK